MKGLFSRLFSRSSNRIVAGLVVFALVAAAVLGFAVPTKATITTPPANMVSRVNNSWYYFTPISTKVITGKTVGDYDSLARWEKLDIQYVVGMTTVNTTTFQLLYSNDAVNWTLGPSWTVATNTTDMTQTWNFGQYTSLQATPLTATYAVTVYATILAK